MLLGGHGFAVLASWLVAVNHWAGGPEAAVSGWLWVWPVGGNVVCVGDAPPVLGDALGGQGFGNPLALSGLPCGACRSGALGPGSWGPVLAPSGVIVSAQRGGPVPAGMPQGTGGMLDWGVLGAPPSYKGEGLWGIEAPCLVRPAF